ncbi:MAG: 4-alpha-glucanotransferase [Pseudolabrys sp.]
MWLLAIQLYSLRSQRNWGIGDFGDLARLIAAAAARGAAGIGLNPLHALFLDRPDQASPYAPNSRLFLNPLYIAVDAIPEFPEAMPADIAEVVSALRDSEFVDYAVVARAKLTVLGLAYARFRENASVARRADFDAFRHEQGETLLRFATFECLRHHYGPTPWREWPAPWRAPTVAQLAGFRARHLDDCEFHEFMQWVAHRQLAGCRDEARRLGMPIGLYTDLAVGIDPDGADAWSRQDAVLCDVVIGAPPDAFNPAGQNWGLAPFNPHGLADDDFRPLRALLRAAMRFSGALRIDHVLALKRLFLIPRGGSAADGAYVRLPFEAMLRVVAEESQRNGCIVIGEDLGTVPEGFRETLAQWGLWSYRVLLFEREPDGRFRPPDAYPEAALVTFNTHDLPSFQGWMTGHDLRVKRAIGVDPGESDGDRAAARAAMRALLLEQAGGEDFAAVAATLARTPARLATVALDDVLGVADQVNIPSTVHEHPNWRRKLPLPLEDLDRDGRLDAVSRVFAEAGRAATA